MGDRSFTQAPSRSSWTRCGLSHRPPPLSKWPWCGWCTEPSASSVSTSLTGSSSTSRAGKPLAWAVCCWRRSICSRPRRCTSSTCAVCQVPILASCWWLLKADEPARGAGLWSFLSGAAIATSLLIRFPALPYVLAFVAVALWRPAARSSKLSFALGVLLVLVLQAASNVVINGDPLYYLFRTARHRAGLGGGYPTAPFWKYAVTLVAAFLPPFSLLFLAAAIRGAKRFALLGIPALAFLVGTSLVPNKQERFLLPVLPVLLILGAIGLPAVRDWFARRGWTRAYNWSWGYFAVVNAALLGVGVFSYGKK